MKRSSKGRTYMIKEKQRKRPRRMAGKELTRKSYKRKKRSTTSRSSQRRTGWGMKYNIWSGSGRGRINPLGNFFKGEQKRKAGRGRRMVFIMRGRSLKRGGKGIDAFKGDHRKA